MKHLLTTFFTFFLCTSVFAQMQPVSSGSYENVQASYEYKFSRKIEKKKKSFDEYYLKMTVEVNNPEPLYSTRNVLVDVKVVNTAKTVYTCSNAADFKGRTTNFTTREGNEIYEIKNGTFNTNCSFRVPVGVDPIVEVNMVDGFKSLSNYDVVVTNQGLAGTWDQGANGKQISIRATEEDLAIISTEDKKLIWKQMTPKRYQREVKTVTGETFISTLEIVDPNTIAYSNSEGVYTLWRRQ